MAKVVKAEGLTPRGQEMAALIAQWEDSGQTMHEFAPRHGVSKHALGWWRWELKRRAQAAASGAPREAIRLVEIARMGTEAASFEVRLVNGVGVTVPASATALQFTCATLRRRPERHIAHPFSVLILAPWNLVRQRLPDTMPSLVRPTWPRISEYHLSLCSLPVSNASLLVA